MALFSSLNIRNILPMSVGNVQQQAVQALVSSVTNSTLLRPPLPVDNVIAGLSSANVTRIIKPNPSPTITKLFNSFDNLTNVIPAFTAKYNAILAPYRFQIKFRDLDRPDASDNLAVETRVLEPYEKLTGISQERPEIVMMTQFKPLFEGGKTGTDAWTSRRLRAAGTYPRMTAAGQFIDVQIQARAIKNVNVITLLRSLSSKDQFIQQSFDSRKTALQSQMSSLQSLFSFLLSLVRKVDIMKGQLDLRDDIFSVNAQIMIRRHTSTYTSSNSNWLFNSLQDMARRFLPSTYNITDVLVRLGYAPKMANELFASTKLWMQLILEYKHIIQHHSLEFLDIKQVAQKGDTNASVLTNPDVPLFGLQDFDPPELPSLEELVALQPSALSTVVRTVERSFGFIYEKGAHFRNNEAQIAALMNEVSKIYSYSSGLADPSTQQALRGYYGFSLTETESGANVGNLKVWDSVLGQFGNNIAQIPDVGDKSLANVAQQRPAANVGVLTFESKYLELDTGSTLTPGATWYVDSIFDLIDQKVSLQPGSSLQLNTTKLDNLSQLLKSTGENFNVIVKGMNVYKATPKETVDRSQESYTVTLGNPGLIAKEILEQFVDTKGSATSLLSRDRLTSVLSFASQNSTVKSILFVYFVNRIARSYNATNRFLIAPVVADNTPLSDALAERLNDVLYQATKPATKQQLQGNVPANDFTPATLKAAFRQGTNLLRFVERLLLQLFTTFKQQKAINGERTLYGAYLNTVVLMTYFDMIVLMISQFGDQKIVGRSSTSTGTTYIVSSASANHLTSYNEILNRLDKESALVQQITWTMMNALMKLGDAVSGLSNYLRSPSSMGKVSQLISLVPNKDELQMLMSEQQILMLASVGEDLVSQAAKPEATLPASGDADSDGDFDTDDELKVIDDSLVSPKVRDALYGIFNTDDFTGPKAYNKRILTVGIPLGFSRRLKQKVSIAQQQKTSFVAKQDDIVQVVVYKSDLVNADIIYKPLRFLFELSRFPVRNDTYYLSLKESPTVDDVIGSVPTRDYEEAFEDGEFNVAYWSPKGDGSKSKQLAMDSASYSFMSVDQKAEVIRNHVMSHLLEVYVKLLTGIVAAEHKFDIDPGDAPASTIEGDYIKLLAEQRLNIFNTFSGLDAASANLQGSGASKTRLPLVSQTGGVLFASTKISKPKATSPATSINVTAAIKQNLTSMSGIAGRIRVASSFAAALKASPPIAPQRLQAKPTTNVSTTLSQISARQVPQVVQSLKTLSWASRMTTTISDPLMVSRNLIRPKQFDRVFNLIIDPDDFDIDVEKTRKTAHGRIALEQLITRGEVVATTVTAADRAYLKRHGLPIASGLFNSQAKLRPGGVGTPDPRVGDFKFRDRVKANGDLIFDKYFVTVETFGEEGV